MGFDKRTVIAMLLIIAILIVTPYYMEWLGITPKPTNVVDSTSVIDELTEDAISTKNEEAKRIDTLNEKNSLSMIKPDENTVIQNKNHFEHFFYEDSVEVLYTVENEFFKAVLSNDNGGNIKSWQLKKYNSFKGGNVQLIKNKFFDFTFNDNQGNVVSSSNVRAIADPSNKKFYQIQPGEKARIIFYLKVSQQSYIKRIFEFDGETYHVNVIQEFHNFNDYMHGNFYDYGLKKGIPYTEKNYKDEIHYNIVDLYMGDELENISPDKEDKTFEYSGEVSWIGIRNKYFVQFLKPFSSDFTTGVRIFSKGKEGYPDSLSFDYDSYITFKRNNNNNYSDSLFVYVGPMDYGILKKYHNDFEKLVMNTSWYDKVTRPIALLMLPIFNFLYGIIGNYGFVIILFSFLLKIILFPLTKKSYQSMKEMQKLQPLIKEINEKYKDDPARKQKAQMELYKKYKINPMGSCLPTLLQMPVLFAMFTLFRSTIQLRGQEFILWIKDLSAPDQLYLGASLPFIGDHLNVLPILSSVAMIYQSKMTSQDSQQKALTYMMPIMMLFFLYNFPSGLHLYYFVFNIMTFLQQKMIHEPVPVEAETKKAIKNKKRK